MRRGRSAINTTRQLLEIPFGEFETPSSRGNLTGHYGATETELDLKVETGALESYRDFINAIQSAKPGSPEEIKVLNGAASWDGKIEADATGTGFNGHIRAERARYENVTVDLLDGDLVYSQDELTLTRGHLRRGAIDTFVDGNLKLTDWSFLPDNAWSVDANFDATPVDALQELIDLHYPVHGNVTGQFHGRGHAARAEHQRTFRSGRRRSLRRRIQSFARAAHGDARRGAHRRRGAAIVSRRERSNARCGHRHRHGGIPDARLQHFGRSRWRVDSAF